MTLIGRRIAADCRTAHVVHCFPGTRRESLRTLPKERGYPKSTALEKRGFSTSFFYFLEELGIMKLFMGLDPGERKRSSNVGFPAVILIYLMRVVAGLRFFWHIHPVILSSQSLMRLVGFNGREIRDGTSARGRKAPLVEPCDDSDKSHGDSQPSPIRGPYCPDSIATYVQAIAAYCFGAALQWGCGLSWQPTPSFPKRSMPSWIHPKSSPLRQCLGCGKVTKEKAPELRRRKERIRKVLETVFGFKIWVVWDPHKPPSSCPAFCRHRGERCRSGTGGS